MPTTPTTPETFASIDPAALETVAGGAARTTARSGGTDDLQLMLTQISSSIKDLAASKSNAGMDPMMMMVMMMMMGGGGGGAVAAPVAAAPVINVSASSRGGCGRGKKGW